MSGGLMSPELYEQLRGVVRSGQRSARTSHALPVELPSRRPRALIELAVIIDADLAAATNSKTGATSCLATVLRWSVADGEYVETALQVTVWNHSESTSYDADTFGVAWPIDGHFWFFGDCSPMASPGRGLPPEDPL